MVFPACVVMRAGPRAGGGPDKVSVMVEPYVNLSDFPLSVSRAELVVAQQSDPSIKVGGRKYCGISKGQGTWLFPGQWCAGEEMGAL